MHDQYVTVIFNEIHEKDVSHAMYPNNKFEVEPYDLARFGLKAAIVFCPNGRGQFQADRYTSFMFGSRVFESPKEAQAHLDEY